MAPEKLRLLPGTDNTDAIFLHARIKLSYDLYGCTVSRFESRLTNPHVVVQEFIGIFYQSASGYTTAGYFRKIDEGVSYNSAEEECDFESPLPMEGSGVCTSYATWTADQQPPPEPVEEPVQEPVPEADSASATIMASLVTLFLTVLSFF